MSIIHKLLKFDASVMNKIYTMKTILAILAITLVLTSVLNSCKKETIVNNYTDTLILPSTPSIVGTTTTYGDTTQITIDGITIHYYSTSPCAPSNEIFHFWATAPSLPANAVLNWYYGDGYSDVNQPLGYVESHLYNSAGKRTLIMQVSINGTVVTTITTTILSWGQNVTPTAGFYTSLNDSNDGNWVAFNSTSSVGSGAIISYQWDFNDGSSDTTSMAYHEHYFPDVAQDKKYNVKLTAVSQAGCKGSVTQDVTVPASYNLPCSFTAQNQHPCAPDTELTYFVANTTGVPSGVKYYWDFSDGISDSTRNYTINHQFIYHGTKAVTLNIKLNGRNLCKAQQGVYVNGSSATPVSYINDASAISTLYYNFNSSGSYANDGYSIKKFYWDFGDGQSDNNNNPDVTHHYNTAGTYYVALTTTVIESGCTNTFTKQVIVK